jgi:hypothetical protein
MIMLRALDEVNQFVRHVRTVKTVEIVDMADLLNMDESGDGRVDMGEYIVHMLKASGHIDEMLLARLQAQFQRLDTSNDGVIGLDDFPPGIALKKIHRDFNGRRVTEITVVSREAPQTCPIKSARPILTPSGYVSGDARYDSTDASGDARREVADKLRAARVEEQLQNVIMQAQIDTVNRLCNELRELCPDSRTWEEMSLPDAGYKPIRAHSHPYDASKIEETRVAVAVTEKSLQEAGGHQEQQLSGESTSAAVEQPRGPHRLPDGSGSIIQGPEHGLCVTGSRFLI